MAAKPNRKWKFERHPSCWASSAFLVYSKVILHWWSTRTARTRPSADWVCRHVCQENYNAHAGTPGTSFKVRIIAQPLFSPCLQRSGSTVTTTIQQAFPWISLLSCLWDKHWALKPAEFKHSALNHTPPPPAEPLWFYVASYLKIPLCGKSSTTDCATKRFFTSMGALVYLQCACWGEGLPARLTVVLLGSPARGGCQHRGDPRTHHCLWCSRNLDSSWKRGNLTQRDRLAVTIHFHFDHGRRCTGDQARSTLAGT